MTGKAPNQDLQELIGRRYAHGFVTDIEADTVAPGLSEEVIRFISAKKGEPDFLLAWRLKAYRHWLTLKEPQWARLHHAPIDYQDISYYSAPKAPGGLKSIDDVDPKLLQTYAKLGIPLHERARLAGVAVDAVFDSVSVATTFKDKLAAAGVIFCSFFGGGKKLSGTDSAVPGHRRALPGQLFCGAEFSSFYRRIFCLYSKGGALPHGTLYLLSDQSGQDRSV